MFVARPVETADAPALEALTAATTPGVYTLPKTRAAIARTIARSIDSFTAQVETPGEEFYCLVLESTVEQAIVGTASVSARAGLNGIFFAFRIDVIQQVSSDLDISHQVHALTLCSDLTGHSQLSGFYLHNRREARAEAALLSRARLLFAAVAPHRFGERFFVSLPGIADSHMRSPFWDALGGKFFRMRFIDAERIVDGARNRSLIVELMPHYPVYVPLLPGAAQAAMGRVHAEGELPYRILTEEGFESDEFIDIFDGGPILRAHRHALRTVSSSLPRRVAPPVDGDVRTVPYLIGSTDERNFRAVAAPCMPLERTDTAALTQEAMRALGVTVGDTVLCARL